jgi:hypothetical protein
MYSTEDEEYAPCAGCHREVSRADQVYAFGDARVLCFDCSEQRHGLFHELLGRWMIAPDIADLCCALERVQSPEPAVPTDPALDPARC